MSLRIQRAPLRQKMTRRLGLLASLISPWDPKNVRWVQIGRSPPASVAAIGRLSTVKMGYWPPLIIIGCVTYAPLSGVYECPLCSHGPRGPVGV